MQPYAATCNQIAIVFICLTKSMPFTILFDNEAKADDAIATSKSSCTIHHLLVSPSDIS